LVLDLESDRMQNLVLRAEAVASEKEVVINERRYRVDDDVAGKANEVLYAEAFRRHPYGWPTIGWMRDIESYSVRDCRDFYRTYYAPNNAILVIAGDFDEREALGLVQERYGRMKSARLPAERARKEPAQRAERRVRLPQPTDTEKLEIGWRAPPWRDEDYALLTILNEVLTGGRSSRLYQALVADGELATSVYASPAPFEHPGLFELSADARPGVTAAQLLEVVDGEIGRIAARGITRAELDKAKNRLELGFLSSMETVAGKAEQIGFTATVADDAGAIFDRLEVFRRAKRDDVRDVARRYLADRRRTVVVVVPSEVRA
jgi:zinc protease